MSAFRLYPHPPAVKAINTMTANDRPDVLHYVGYDTDRGGIISIVRALSQEQRFRCILGVNPGFMQLRLPALPSLEFPPLQGERLGLRTLWRARAVALRVRDWLHDDGSRVFHGHSRAGLAVGVWLSWLNERRNVASVHCYGRQRWFYRWCNRRMGQGMYWLSPEMRRYYGIAGSAWEQCIPGCFPSGDVGRPLQRSPLPEIVRLGGVGALVPWKKWGLILDALAAVPRAVRDRLHFSHIGAGDGTPMSVRYEASLLEKTRALGLEGTVTWKGEQASAREFMGSIDCLVIASDHEPFSIAMLEALAVGVPVLAADSGGARDVIQESVNGWFYRTNSVGDLCRSLTLLATTDALCNVALDPDSVLRFSADQIAAQWAKVYSTLLAGNKP